jgi:hypothetical protein
MTNAIYDGTTMMSQLFEEDQPLTFEHRADQGHMTRQHPDTLPIKSRYFADMVLASGWTPGARIPYDVAPEGS